MAGKAWPFAHTLNLEGKNTGGFLFQIILVTFPMLFKMSILLVSDVLACH